MTDKTTQPETISKRPRIHPLNTFLQGGLLIVLVAAGWFFRGMMPAGQPVGRAGGAPPGDAKPPTVIVEAVEEGLASAPQEFIGHVEAIQTVDLHAQVAGYIEAVHFEEGSLVAEGDLLVSIEQDQYEAQVALSGATLVQAQANLEGAKADLDATRASLEASRASLERAQKYFDRLKKADARSIVQADLDDAESQLLQARAQVKQCGAQVELKKTRISQFEAAIHQAKANLELSRINLGYTEIRSPINGRIGKALITKGNYVGPNTGTLARVVQTDPIRVVFSMSDRGFLKALQKESGRSGFDYRARLRLPNDSFYPAFGRWDYEDNEMDPATGTIAIRASFENPKGILVPQTYVRVVLTDNNSEMVPTAPQEAAA